LNLTDQMRAAGVDFKPVVFQDIDPTYQAYEQGRCDAVTSDKSQLAGRRSVFKTPADHEIMDVTMSKEPLGPVVPLGDDQWYNVVKWVVFATFQAEESGVTSKNVDEMAKSKDPVISRLLGDDALAKGLGLDKDWVVKVVKAVGNYGEIYDRSLGTKHTVEHSTRVEQTMDAGRLALRDAVPLKSRLPTKNGGEER